MKIILLIILLVSLADSQFTTCVPSLDCSSSALLDKVPDPTSCSRYYICVKVDNSIVPSDSYFDCPTSEYFDPQLKECSRQDGPICYNTCSNHCNMICDSTTEGITRVAFPGEVDRYNACVGGTPSETLCPAAEPYFNGQDCVADASAICDFCSPHCSTVGLQIADPSDCTKFFICSGIGNPDWDLHGSCDSGQVFNPVTGTCVTGESCNAICK